MIGIHNFRSFPTQLKLNGPILSFSSNPESTRESLAGFATFTGIATANFPAGSGNVVGGSITFSWFLGGIEVFDITQDPTSNASIQSFGNISTCTFNNSTFLDNGKDVVCRADYLPADGEANAIVDPFDSSPATLSVFPEIVISNQPKDVLTGAGVNAVFDVDASIIPSNNETISYQWQMDGIDIVNGSNTFTETTESITTKIAVTSDEGDNFTIDFSRTASFSGFLPGRIYTLTPDTSLTIKAYATGGGGGGGTARVSGRTAGRGGAAQGKVTLFVGEQYKLIVGTRGTPNGVTDVSGGGRGYFGGNSGGGFTGLFKTSVTQANSILIAGGGGGAGEINNRPGGDGGGLVGGSPSINGFNFPDSGGTQTGGGRGFYSDLPGYEFMNGTALRGGTAGTNTGTNAGGGGGGGYFGGGAGRGDSNFAPGPYGGGGGSGYIHPTLVTEGAFSRANSADQNSRYPTSGTFKIDRVSQIKQSFVTASGVNTPTLILNTNETNFGGVVQSKLSAPNVQTSPIITAPASYSVVVPRSLIRFEAYDNNLNFKTTENIFDQTNSSFVLNSDTFGSGYNITQFYSSEKQFKVRMDMKASRGNGNGGPGGSSIIEFIMNQGVEYTIIGIQDSSVDKSSTGIFLYRGSKLISVVGGGGNGGVDGKVGGSGGGVNVDGSDGAGQNGGRGGVSPGRGGLSLSGIFGSSVGTTTPTLQSGDTSFTAPDPRGGRTISCTKGSYWINLGISPCSNNSEQLIQYFNSDGSVQDQSSFLIRGFKPGYTITQTGGAGSLENERSGQGGSGATGGSGGINNAPGGGGSGYTDGSVNVIQTRLGGGNDRKSSITFTVVE